MSEGRTQTVRQILRNQHTIMKTLMILCQDASGQPGNVYHSDRLRERVLETERGWPDCIRPSERVGP